MLVVVIVDNAVPMLAQILTEILGRFLLQGLEQRQHGLNVPLPQSCLSLIETFDRPADFVQVLDQVIPVKHLSSRVISAHRRHQIPHPVVPVSQACQRHSQGLLVDPISQSIVLLVVGNHRSVAGNGFVIFPLAGFTQRRPHPHLAAIDADFRELAQLRCAEVMGVNQTLLGLGRHSNTRQVAHVLAGLSVGNIGAHAQAAVLQMGADLAISFNREPFGLLTGDNQLS